MRVLRSGLLVLVVAGLTAPACTSDDDPAPGDTSDPGGSAESSAPLIDPALSDPWGTPSVSGVDLSKTPALLTEESCDFVQADPPPPPGVVIEAVRIVNGCARTVFVPAGEDPDAVLAELRAVPDIVAADVVPTMSIDTVAAVDPEADRQWGNKRLGYDEVDDLVPERSDVAVAVLDTGVDMSHDDLLSAPYLSGVPVKAGFDDAHGHGTHVAGIVAAEADNGVAGHGFAPDVKVLALKIDLEGVDDPDYTTAQAIRLAADTGAVAINMSFGSPVSDATTEWSIRYALAKGVVLVASAGNCGVRTEWCDKKNRVQYPAAYPGVVAVAATAKDDKRASLSTANEHVDLAAPGEQIVSVEANTDSDVKLLSGTSQAAPFVTATAALIAARSPGIEPQEIVAAMLDTAPDRDHRTDQLGYGIVDPPAALRSVGEGSAPNSAAQPGEGIDWANRTYDLSTCRSHLERDSTPDALAAVAFTDGHAGIGDAYATVTAVEGSGGRPTALFFTCSSAGQGHGGFAALVDRRADPGAEYLYQTDVLLGNVGDGWHLRARPLESGTGSYFDATAAIGTYDAYWVSNAWGQSQEGIADPTEVHTIEPFQIRKRRVDERRWRWVIQPTPVVFNVRVLDDDAATWGEWSGACLDARSSIEYLRSSGDDLGSIALVRSDGDGTRFTVHPGAPEEATFQAAQGWNPPLEQDAVPPGALTAVLAWGESTPGGTDHCMTPPVYQRYMAPRSGPQAFLEQFLSDAMASGSIDPSAVADQGVIESLGFISGEWESYRLEWDETCEPDPSTGSGTCKVTLVAPGESEVSYELWYGESPTGGFELTDAVPADGG